jgi:hypothetical protein
MDSQGKGRADDGQTRNGTYNRNTISQLIQQEYARMFAVVDYYDAIEERRMPQSSQLSSSNYSRAGTGGS